MTEYAAYLGIDWADKKHDPCLLDVAMGKKTRLVIQHTPAAIAEYFASLLVRYPGQRIAVGLEQSRGPFCLRFCNTTFWCCIPSTPPRW